MRSFMPHPGLACTAALFAIVPATSVTAQAQATDPVPVVSVEPAQSDARPAAAEPGLFDTGPLGESALAEAAGRAATPTWQASNAQSNATVKDNSVGNNSPTGALAVTDSAFQNVSGISMVNLNTGNASSINATMNVNLSISMAPPTSGGM